MKTEPLDFKLQNVDFAKRVEDSFKCQQAMKTLGATLASVSPGEVIINLPYNQKLTQQHGFIHAGIVSTVLDSACGYAAFSLMPKNAGVLTIEFKINLLSPAKGDWFEAVGRVKKPGRNISVAEGEIFSHENGNKKLIATMSATLMSVYDRADVAH